MIGLLKKPLFDWPIWLKGNPKRTSRNSLLSVEGPEQGSRFGFAEDTIGVRLRLWRRLCEWHPTRVGLAGRFAAILEHSGQLKKPGFELLHSPGYLSGAITTQTKKRKAIEIACERQTFLLAHRRWGTFLEEELRVKRPPAAMSEEKRLPFAGYNLDSKRLKKFKVSL